MNTIARINNVVTIPSSNIASYAQELARDAERVVNHLLPYARKEGREMKVGSTSGEPGDSLSVCILGDKAGVWADFATGQSGDLIELWREVRGLSMADALREIKDWLGIREDAFPVRPMLPSYKRPEAHKGMDSLPVMAYLTSERKLTTDTLRAFGIESKQGIWFGETRSDAYYLPSYWDVELIRWKLIGLNRKDNGKKLIQVSKDAEPCLFGWQAIPPDASSVVIVEGELDAMSGHQYGYACLSIPYGGGGGKKQDWIEAERSYLERFKIIFLCLDQDEEGQKATEEIARRLGERCRVVSLPHKDFNDCLLAGMSKEAIDDCFQGAKPINAEADIWPEPDMSIVQGSQTPAPAFPLHVFGALSGWIAQAAEAKNAPSDYVAAGMLGVAASLIGNSRKVMPWQGWTEPAVLWLALVGRPSAGKSPALDAVLEPLRSLEKDIQADYPARKQDYESQVEIAKTAKAEWLAEVKDAMQTYPRTVDSIIPPKPDAAMEPEAPTLARIRVGDATVESLARVLKGNPRGVLMHRDELAGWLEGMGRYNSGGDRQFWLEAFGARSYTLDRVKYQDDPLVIERLAVSSLGGIQPDRLADLLLHGSDDGLTSRFLYVWPDSLPPKRPGHDFDANLPLGVFIRLYGLTMREEPQVMLLTSEAAALFEAFWKELRQQEEDASGLLQGNIGKLPGLTLRLALVLELLWWAGSGESNPPGEVSHDAILCAYSLVSDYFLPMARRAFGDAALPEVEKDATALARWLLKEKPETVNIRSLWRSKTAGLGAAEAAIKAVLELVDAGWLFANPTRKGGGPGKQKKDYVINPRVFTSPQESL